jgi:fluoride ion exporter CrcB/FEX
MSTFSTFAVEAVELAGRRRLIATATYPVASLLLGIAAVAGGYQITR